MPFGFGPGELMLLGLIVFIFFGPLKLPNLGERLAEWMRAAGMRKPDGVFGPWTWSDWILVAAVVVAGASVVVAAVGWS